METVQIRIKNDGARFIYTDKMAGFIRRASSEGSARRVSHVEPDGDGWTATMDDGTVLGPYPLRQEALDAEREYLAEREGL